MFGLSLLVNIKKKFYKTKATIDTVIDTMKKLEEEEGLGNLVPKKSNRKVRQTLID